MKGLARNLVKRKPSSKAANSRQILQRVKIGINIEKRQKDYENHMEKTEANKQLIKKLGEEKLQRIQRSARWFDWESSAGGRGCASSG